MMSVEYVAAANDGGAGYMLGRLGLKVCLGSFGC